MRASGFRSPAFAILGCRKPKAERIKPKVLPCPFSDSQLHDRTGYSVSLLEVPLRALHEINGLYDITSLASVVHFFKPWKP